MWTVVVMGKVLMVTAIVTPCVTALVIAVQITRTYVVS